MSERLLTGHCSVNGREFILEILPMVNGCFASVTEDHEPRMGVISLSIESERKSIYSSSLIPDRRGGMFAGMVGETLAERFGGIATVSLYLREDMDAETMKTLISEVRKLVK